VASSIAAGGSAPAAAAAAAGMLYISHDTILLASMQLCNTDASAAHTLAA
jgi:hypothetical protein